MTTDRELLELAANAAGRTVEGFSPQKGLLVSLRDGVSAWWNPLTTDGDNRRLQVALKVGLVPIEDGGWACITWDHDDQVTLAADLDPNRAIVRAAAAIGKAIR